MDISDIFDVSNTRHLQAFRELNSVGSWPAGFIAELEKQSGGPITFRSCWLVEILNKLANAYVAEKLGIPIH